MAVKILPVTEEDLKWICGEVLKAQETLNKTSKLAEGLWRRGYPATELEIPTSFRSLFHQLERLWWESQNFEELYELYELDESFIMAVGVCSGNRDTFFKMPKQLVKYKV